jgi:PAS domain S-box-containing protein
LKISTDPRVDSPVTGANRAEHGIARDAGVSAPLRDRAAPPMPGERPGAARGDAVPAAFDELESIYRTAPIGLALIDREGRYARVNDRLAQINGIPAPAHIGRRLRDIVPDLASQAEDIVACVFRTGQPVLDVELEGETRAQPGVRRCWNESWYPLKDDRGRTIAINVVVEEITERKRAEAMLRDHARQLALIADTAPVYIAYCDTEARYKFVNRPYAARLGLTPADCIGKRIPEVVGATAYAAFREQVETVLRGECVEFDVGVPYAALGERFMHCSYAPEFDGAGRVVGFVAAVTDITERRRIEEALRLSEEKLKEADRRKDEFLAMLAHELRNPLAPIANAVHLLRQDPAGRPARQQAHAIIERQTGHLARLVDDLLEVSRITTGRIRLHMERIAAGGVIERAVETVRPLIEHRRHALTVALPPAPLWLYADAARLEQVVVNLLNNAAKYTDEGGRIGLSVECDAGHMVLRVRDSGIGIGAELLPHIFDPFTQAARSLDRSHSGLGIGLSLVQRLVSMHGGTVAVQSAVGQGSEFTVRLPLAEAPREVYATVPEPAAETGRPLRVLVVDDNVDAAQSLSMLLEVSGHVVWVAHNGMAAVETAIEYRPHVVLLDIGLPKLDGYEVAQRLRADATCANMVLVAMTGYGQAADRERAKSAGFDHHLVKPVDFSNVEELLADVSRRLPH